MEEKKTISELYAEIDEAKERIKSLDEEKAEIKKGMRKTDNQIWLQRQSKKEGEKESSEPSPSRVSRR